MTPDDVRFIGNLRAVLSRASTERLYYTVQAIHHELLNRDNAAKYEAAALELALLVETRVARAQLYSAPAAEES